MRYKSIIVVKFNFDDSFLSSSVSAAAGWCNSPTCYGLLGFEQRWCYLEGDVSYVQFRTVMWRKFCIFYGACLKQSWLDVTCFLEFCCLPGRLTTLSAHLICALRACLYLRNFIVLPICMLLRNSRFCGRVVSSTCTTWCRTRVECTASWSTPGCQSCTQYYWIMPSACRDQSTTCVSPSLRSPCLILICEWLQ